MDSAALKYAVHVSTSYNGDARDMFGGSPNPVGDHNGMKFSAKDRDNDLHASKNCAQFYASGWWYHGCYFFNPTGASSEYRGFVSFGLAGSWTLQKTRMMMKIAD